MTEQPDLLTGELTRLVAPDPETDAETVARWMGDAEFLRLFDSGPARMWTPARVKRETEEYMGKDEPKASVFPFYIRTLADNRLIGMLDLDIPNWSQRDAWIGIGLGEREYWGKGYGTDAMRLALRFAFTELNLRRVSLSVFEYNARGLRSYLKAGFQVEGRVRERLRRDGRRWDMVCMGILREEWTEFQGRGRAVGRELEYGQ